MANIIRTTAVELSIIPALAYKQKLASGGAGIKIHRLDKDESAVFAIDRRTGEANPPVKVDADLFPEEAVLEAMELTSGQPYTARGKLRIYYTEEILDNEEDDDEEDVEETETEKTDMVESVEYKAFIDRYTNEKGKLNYTLMNKDFIQFASKSKIIGNMVAEKTEVDQVIHYIINNRAAFLAGKKENLSDQETAALIETLDEIDPRSAFKELGAYIKRLLAKVK
ncbi:MAG: hypothetical protein LBH09_01615 [Peptococcaceae bacterium]|jgi:hypothetical protein|nr:hypothetical protein [Peptococcaceae bacterium]